MEEDPHRGQWEELNLGTLRKKNRWICLYWERKGGREKPVDTFRVPRPWSQKRCYPRNMQRAWLVWGHATSMWID